ncbi:MAG TPA: hypothetical protein VH598_11895, partial [Verrucomicrobiae bacterium]|nr:hypothetical protein [Verrucomicrobiae bacterium]
MKRIARSNPLITAICLAGAAFAPVPASAQVETRVPPVETRIAPTTFSTRPILLAQSSGGGGTAPNTPADATAPETSAALPATAQQEVRAGGSAGSYPGVSWSTAPGAIGGMGYGVSTGRGDRALVVRSSETDPKTITEAEEDLNVMGLILEKALYQSGDQEEREAMGIRLWTAASGSPARRSLEIEGYGAVFLLNVNFPLAGPAEKPNEDKKESSNSTWDEAKRELYGQSEGNQDANFQSASGRFDTFMNRFPKEEYDPKRVEKLKDSLLEALKNAANLRGLKSDESVTVVVTSRFSPRVGRTRVLRGVQKNGTAAGGYGGGGFGRFGGGGGGGGGSAMTPFLVDGNSNPDERGSVLTIRARKSDIDVFAKGKLTMDDFRKKASMVIY